MGGLVGTLILMTAHRAENDYSTRNFIANFHEQTHRVLDTHDSLEG